MKIEIWSDYACPFCYIGEKRLEKALAEVDNGDIDIEFKSFELDPTASNEVVSNTIDRFAIKYGMSKEDAAHRIEQISMMGRREGIDFKYSSTRYTNTFDSLRLTKLAQEHGHNEIITKLFDAYFTKNLELSNHHVLKKIAVECGLDENEVDVLLNSDKYAAEVRNDEREAAMLGINGVPYFVIGGKYGLSGAQPVEVLKQAITEAMTNEADETFNGMTCGPNGCHFES
ncbi:MAG: DsbA family oxidoreductase [Selenomonadaceae bacterium]|nr:DsbA family oxidoreductase [Selenomonadaceae bacterium]